MSAPPDAAPARFTRSGLAPTSPSVYPGAALTAPRQGLGGMLKTPRFVLVRWRLSPASARTRRATARGSVLSGAAAFALVTVAAAVAHALTAQRPRTHYLVGRDAKFRAALAAAQKEHATVANKIDALRASAAALLA